MVHPLVKGGTALLNAPVILESVGVHQAAVVADLGCGGVGHFVAPTSFAVGSGGRVYAVDVQRTVLHNVESRLKMQNITNVTTLWSNLEHVGAAKIPDHSCDFAFLVNVLFQNKDHVAILKEAHRILKPGKGTLVVIEWKKSASLIGPPLDFRIDRATIQQQAQQIGCTFVREFDPGTYHYGLVFSA
ncbi:MAG: methyltransferase domain-containing protein [bacterium]|nr:methyltransferase domain-containing protein [bacterium]